jgi:Universal stress protein family
VCVARVDRRPGGRAAGLILAQAKLWPADLIVMGTQRRRGLVRIALGSDAETVVHGATLPVLVVRSKPEKSETPEHTLVEACAVGLGLTEKQAPH